MPCTLVDKDGLGRIINIMIIIHFLESNGWFLIVLVLSDEIKDMYST